MLKAILDSKWVAIIFAAWTGWYLFNVIFGKQATSPVNLNLWIAAGFLAAALL